jgi:hypothetical protein
MPRYVIPANAGPYEVLTSRAGTPLVANNYNGPRKVRIPCRTKDQALEVCRRLNAGPHGQVIFV